MLTFLREYLNMLNFTGRLGPVLLGLSLILLALAGTACINLSIYFLFPKSFSRIADLEPETVSAVVEDGGRPRFYLPTGANLPREVYGLFDSLPLQPLPQGMEAKS